MNKAILLSIIIASGAYRSMATQCDARLAEVQHPDAITIRIIAVPGGEHVLFDSHMTNFLAYVRENPGEIQTYLSNNPMSKEIAIALGLVPQKWAVDALIAAIPTNGILNRIPPMNAPAWSHTLTNYNDSTTMLYYCCIHSLTYATGHAIGRSRYGTYFVPEVKMQWQSWWEANRASFAFDTVQWTTSCGRYPQLSVTQTRSIEHATQPEEQQSEHIDAP